MQCLVHFHTRIRLLNHIRYKSKPCQAMYSAWGPCMSAEQADAIEADLRSDNRQLYVEGRRTHHARLMAYRLPGPPRFLMLR